MRAWATGLFQPIRLRGKATPGPDTLAPSACEARGTPLALTRWQCARPLPHPSRCGGLYGTVLSRAYNMSALTNTTRILVIGATSTALNSFNSWLDQARLARTLVDVVLNETALNATSFGNYRVIHVPSSSFQTSGGLSNAMSNSLMRRRAFLSDYVNVLGGSLIVLTQDGQSNPYGFFPSPLVYVRTDYINVTASVNMPQISAPTDSVNLDHNAWHGYFTGPRDFAGIMQVLVSPL